MNVRIGIDFDNNRWIDWEGNSPLNLVPNSLFFTTLAHQESNCTYVDRLEKTTYGLEIRKLKFAAAGAAYHNIGTPGTSPINTVTGFGIYTAVIWARSSNTFSLRMDAYHPSFGTVLATGSAVALNGDLQKITVTFTCPNSTYDVYFRLVKVNSGDVGNVEITGFGLYETTSPPAYNSGTAPNLIADPLNFTNLTTTILTGLLTPEDLKTKYGKKAMTHTGFLASDTGVSFYIPNITASNRPFTIVCWIQNTLVADTSGEFFYIQAFDHGSHVLLATSPSVKVGTEFQRFELKFRMPVPATGLDFTIVRDYGSTAYFSYRVTGLGVYEGFNSPNFNAGSTNELISMLGFVTSSGMNTEIGSLTAADGFIEITVDNESRDWTPRNESSPYFAKLRSNTIIEVQISEAENGLWRQLWTGLYDHIELTTGLTGNRQAVIYGTQGLSYMNDSRVLYPPTLSKRADQILAVALGYALLASDRYSWVLGESQLGINNFLADGAAYSVLEQTSYTFPVAGAGTEPDASARDFFDTVVINEGGYSYFDRFGRPVFRKRYEPPITEIRPGQWPVIIRPVGL